jgi:SAM-dependent methyltransferase
MNWKTKHFFQSHFPKVLIDSGFYYLLQKNFGGLKHFSINSKVDQGISLLEALHANNIEIQGKHTAEIGTGWVPIIPMLFAILGQSDCITCDVKNLLKNDLCIQAAEQFNRLGPYLSKKLPWAWGEETIESLRSFGSIRDSNLLLKSLRISYFSDTYNPLRFIENASIDIFFSNETLEHIPCEQLPALLSEIWRALKPNGIMIHMVDCSDHYSFEDPSINRINFLRFTAKEWAHYNNQFLFQNRLRPSDFREMMNAAGFSIEYWKQKVDSRAFSDIENFPVSFEFQNYSVEDICTSSFLVIARAIAKI